jgi:hypothetical protein
MVSCLALNQSFAQITGQGTLEDLCHFHSNKNILYKNAMLEFMAISLVLKHQWISVAKPSG